MKTKQPTQRSPKRPAQAAQPKPQYHLRNWKEYNAALKQRGSLTVWLDEQAIEHWYAATHHGGRGAACRYSDGTILCALTLQAVYHLPLRATQGFLSSMLELLGVDVLAPDYSTLSRRRTDLEVPVRQAAQSYRELLHQGQGMHLVVDSTGCKIHGEGEWKVRQHGYSKRRAWRKLHIGADAATGTIEAVVLTTNAVADSAVLPELLEQVEEPIAQLCADGGYDKRPCYDSLRQRQRDQGQPLQVTIPPRHGARIWQHGNSRAERLARDENLRRMRQLGRAAWKQESGYHQRSLVETTMFRLKTIFGGRLSARDFAGQATEAFIRCRALNTMTALGLPDSYAV